MKKIIGITLISVPFIFAFIVLAISDWKAFQLTLVFGIGFLFFFGLGAYLLADE